MIRRFFRTALLLLDGLLLLLFAVGYAARYFHPRFAWWAELVATGLPYLSLLLLPATALVALSRRWLLLGLHLLLLGLALVRFVPLERGAPPGPDDLVLLTFNISRGGGARADQQSRAVAALVRAEKPDVVALQEAFIEYHPTGRAVRPDAPVAALIDSMGYRTIGPDGSNGAVFTPQPVLAHVELLEQTQHLLDATETPSRPPASCAPASAGRDARPSITTSTCAPSATANRGKMSAAALRAAGSATCGSTATPTWSGRARWNRSAPCWRRRRCR